jgi:alkanesulfonate monooxygenase SsuD/methylene tetrahydromethanopterin reductase-like flavin-dependent oxidoreductase (luciferase family)
VRILVRLASGFREMRGRMPPAQLRSGILSVDGGGGMADLVEVPVGDTVVLMAVSELDAGVVRAARPGRVVARASQSLEDMLQGLRPVAESFVQQFAEMTRAPNEIKVEFGVTLSAQADVVIASTATEATFSVSLMWSDSS